MHNVGVHMLAITKGSCRLFNVLEKHDYCKGTLVPESKNKLTMTVFVCMTGLLSSCSLCSQRYEITHAQCLLIPVGQEKRVG